MPSLKMKAAVFLPRSALVGIQMNSLVKEVRGLARGELKQRIDARLGDFKAVQQKGEKEWFCEFCFCLLTPNAKSKTACAVQAELGFKGFYTADHDALVQCLLRNKHRFHNIKSARIVENRKHFGIKRQVQSIIANDGLLAARAWLQENIKGYGYKEASHFLRNVGYTDVAILDRHIVNLMVEHRIIRRPKNLNKKTYLRLEKRFGQLATEASMTMAELDMYMWYMKAKDVLK